MLESIIIFAYLRYEFEILTKDCKGIDLYFTNEQTPVAMFFCFLVLIISC